MRALYKKGEANFPRLATDSFFLDYENTFHFSGITDATMDFVQEHQLLDGELWASFVRQFAQKSDSDDLTWRGEYWGKMMRGASFVYSYTKSERLMEVLCTTVRDMLDREDELGRISTYGTQTEFNGWDMWSRKYVLLGMQYFLEINTDKELAESIVASMCRQVDYIMSKVGPAEKGLTPITHTSKHWHGLNSSSILEPIVRLYNITGKQSYFDFANYIADEGGCYAENVFRLAEKKQLRLYQYPVTKAYEMISCFEGLLELYRITGTPWYKAAILNFADLILEDDFTVIGSAGCTHELFDHSTVRQANTDNCNIMQETCVTVTLMKFFLQLNLFTGNVKYADAYERAYYNAYLGSVNTEHRHSTHEFPKGVVPKPMPFDSYSPLTADVRGKAVGGFRVLDGHSFYGCCVCIAAAGIGSVPKMALASFDKGLVMNLYIDGEISTLSPGGNPVRLITKTAYPADGTVSITVENASNEHFTLRLRIPDWCDSLTLTQNGKAIEAGKGYVDTEISDKIEYVELCFDMPTRVIRPIPYGEQVLMNKVIWGNRSMVVPTYDKEDEDAKNHVALRRGPLMLAQDSRFGYSLKEPARFVFENECAEVKAASADFDTLLTLDVKTESGFIRLCDYQSAGKLYSDESICAVWMKNN